MSHVVLERLEKSYGGVTAVGGIDLSIGEGEFLVLLGPSGCGKTTTLRCIAGLEEITGGRILIDGKPVSTATMTTPPEQRQMGMVFQSYAVWPHMTVFENIAFGLKLQKLSKAEISARVGRALGLVGLGALAGRAIHQMSGGQQQRVALARAVALEPRVLLFDEPLSNLDAQLREYMRFELRQLQQRLGITAVYVTHDQQEAMVVADRVALMNKGRIEQVGTPKQIYRHPASLFAATFIGLANSIAATVVGDGVIALADGVQFHTEQRGFSIGQVVRMIVRPEHVRLATEATLNAYPVVVRDSAFLGNITDVTVMLGATALRAQPSPAFDFEPGAPTTLSIAPDAITLIAE